MAALLGAIALVVAAVVWAASKRLERATATRVDDLLAGAEVPQRGPVTEDDLQSLPPPVRRYLDAVYADDLRPIETVRLTQRGELRLGDTSGSWKPFGATQHVSVDPPGFLWDATVEVVPFVPARVVDAYEDGEGSLSARLLSTLPVADAGSTPEMDEGELLRFLGEAVWYPSVLVSEAVEWEPIDDRSALARIVDRGNEAALEFRFDEDDLVESVHAEARYRQEDDGVAPWTGHFSAYHERNGVLVPLEASVEWNLREGDRPYWRAHVESIDHEFVG